MGLRIRTARIAAWTTRWMTVLLLWLAAMLACATDADAAFDIGLSPEVHSLLSAAAIIAVLSAVIWTGFRKFGGPRLRPGQRVVSDDDYFLLQEAVVRGVVLARDQAEEDAQGPLLRSV